MHNKSTTKPNKTAKKTPVATVREGAIAANIFCSQSSDGYEYHYFLLSRSWQSTPQGREGYSERYFPRNAEALGRVAMLAANRCEELDRQLTEVATSEAA